MMDYFKKCPKCGRYIDAFRRIGKGAREIGRIYPIFGRIPPLLSEVKVGDECRLFFY